MFRKYGLFVLTALLGCGCLLSASAAGTADKATASAKAAAAKTAATKTTHRHVRVAGRHTRTAAGFVPPPPAYMPSILPEITARRMQGINEVADGDDKPVNPYAKYIQTPGSNQPQAIETRKGVVVWARRS